MLTRNGNGSEMFCISRRNDYSVHSRTMDFDLPRPAIVLLLGHFHIGHFMLLLVVTMTTVDDLHQRHRARGKLVRHCCVLTLP